MQLSNQKRQILKDKFKGFNTELEEQLRIQKDWSIPDPSLRARVRNDNVDYLVPLYTAFYERYTLTRLWRETGDSLYHYRYATLNFTKNPDKYLKYTPDALQDLLLTFFDGGALWYQNFLWSLSNFPTQQLLPPVHPCLKRAFLRTILHIDTVCS